MREPIRGVAALCLLCLACAERDVGTSAQDYAALELVAESRIDGHEHSLVPIDTTFRVAVAPDGTIAIAQLQTSEIRLFSPAGEPIGAVGRRGRGPGEFEQLSRLGWMGDTLYAYDLTLRRFTLFDNEYEYLREVRVPDAVSPSADLATRVPGFGIVHGLALYPDGSVYGRLSGPQRQIQSEEFDATLTTYGRVTSEGVILSYVQWSPGSDPIEMRVGERVAMMSADILPSERRPFLSLSPDGRLLARLDVFMSGADQGSYEIVVADVLSASEVYVQRDAFDVRPITQQIRDSILDSRLAGVPAEMAAAYREHGRFPPLLPPVEGIVLGRDRTLWVRLATTPFGRPYRIYDPRGALVATVVLPESERVVVADLSERSIWVIEKDAVGVESLLRYRIA